MLIIWMKLTLYSCIVHSSSDVWLFKNVMQGIITMKPCGVGYWILSSLQIPLAIAFTAWILCRKESTQYHAPNQQVLKRTQITAKNWQASY